MKKDDAKTCERLVEFEERASSLYAALANRFAENKDLRGFWLGMSMGEKQHALFLGFCNDQRLVTEGLPDRNRVRDLSKFLGALEKRVRRKALSVDDAFLIAGDLERSEINDVFAGVIRAVPETWYIMRKKVEALSSDHMQILVGAARKFGASAPVVATLAKG